jgi:phosphate-selective porin OprO/OprP
MRHETRVARQDRTHSTLKGGVALLALVGACALPAAAHADTASEIKALKAQLKRLEAKLDEQAKATHQVKNALNSAKSAPGDHHAPPPVFVSFKNGLYVETEDKAFSFHIGGRVHVDGGFQGDPKTGDASNVLLRRARLDIQGKAFKNWYYRTQFEFGGGNANVRDAWLGYKGPILAELGYDKPLFIQIGNHLRPLGLEAMSTSNSGITFIERTMMSDVFNTPRRHLGASVSAGEHNWGAKLGLYSASPQDAALRPNRNGMGQYFEVAGRAVVLPIRTEEDMIHIGASGRYRSAGGTSAASDDELLFGRGPRNEANALNTRLLGSPDLSCNPARLQHRRPRHSRAVQRAGRIRPHLLQPRLEQIRAASEHARPADLAPRRRPGPRELGGLRRLVCAGRSVPDRRNPHHGLHRSRS